MKMIKVILALITIMVIVAFLYSTNHLNSTFCGLAIVFYSISMFFSFSITNFSYTKNDWGR